MFYSISSCSVWMSLSMHLNSLIFSFTRLIVCLHSHFSYNKSLSIYVRLYHPLHLCSLHHPLYPLHLCSLVPPIIGHSTTPLPFTRILYTILSISIIYVRLYHSLYLHHLCSLVPSSYLSLSITNTATVAPVIDVKKCNPDTLPNSIRKRL